MANKKASSSAKKASKPSSAEHATKVTTVKASDTRPATVTSKEGRSFVSRLSRMPVVASAIAEFIGTFLLASVIITQQNQPIALFFALIGIILIVGGVSGGHLNPAITIGAWVTRKLESTRAIAYLAAQILGALLAFVVLTAFVKQAPEVSQQAAMFGQGSAELFKAAAIPTGKEWALLFAELIGVTILGFAYASALQKGRERIVAAFSIGAGMFLALIFAGTAATYVEASAILNPAAAISLEALSDLSSPWPVIIYVITPAIGGVLGFALFGLLREAEE